MEEIASVADGLALDTVSVGNTLEELVISGTAEAARLEAGIAEEAWPGEEVPDSDDGSGLGATVGCP